MNKNEKYFLNSLLSVAPRCTLLPSVVGAYNTVYLAHSCRRSTHICLRYATANIRYTGTLYEISFTLSNTKYSNRIKRFICLYLSFQNSWIHLTTQHIRLASLPGALSQLAQAYAFGILYACRKFAYAGTLADIALVLFIYKNTFKNKHSFQSST